VVDNSYNNEEKNECTEKELPKNTAQRRAQGKQEKPVYRGEEKYQAAIRKEKTNSWKQHCTITTPNNPWNEVYKLAAGKTRETLTLTTLQKLDSSRTSNKDETLQTMMDLLIPEDSTQDDTIQHKNMRRLAAQLIDTANDQEFTQDEVRQTIESFNSRKVPGPDGITREILILIFQNIPQTMTAICNDCLKRRHFPKQWKIAKIIPITKLGKKRQLRPIKILPD
jgi:hypothetical protein